ncbi:ketopantoate reductase family protein [Actinomadura sp. 7K507]|nr:2-dehydropantoate 2-reductase N-terminal domain-containing protein [Actinomadura sp. 7K507]TDC85563.1 ketopantoate reductase family protein [Actinomadura sp. 7K507]
MRFIVLGAGAIGGVVGARLFQHGHEVVLVARGAHLAAVRERGLRLESPVETVTLPVPVVGHPRDISFRADDVVLLAVKGQHTVEALQGLLEGGPARLPVVCAQNGVANEPTTLRFFPDVYGLSVMLPAAFLEAGTVRAYSSPVTGVLDIGRWPAGTGPLAEEIAAAFLASGFVAETSDDIAAVKYGKLLSNLGNAIEAVCGPAARRGHLDALARQEAETCYRAAGIDYVVEDTASRRLELVKPEPLPSGRRPGASSWQSLERGAGTIETDYLNGEIVMLGRLHGVPTPVNELLQRTAARMSREKRPPGLMSEAVFLAHVHGG